VFYPVQFVTNLKRKNEFFYKYCYFCSDKQFLYMKKILLIAFAAMAVCMTSCKKEQPAPKPDYREDAFEVCKGYLNQNGNDVVNKLYEDWNGESLVTSGESRFFKAKYEEIEVFVDANTNKVYKVSYLIGLPNSDRAKANGYVNNFSQKVSAFYTTDKPTKYNVGRVFTKDSSFSSNDHKDFMQSLSTYMNDYNEIEEEWGDVKLLEACQKTWEVKFDQDKSEVHARFILDLG